MYKVKSFKITNYRSFFNEQKLDLSKNNITAIYGPNASGKSNIARALSFMKWLIFNSAKAELNTIPFEPFLLRDKNHLPTSFEIEFLNGDNAFLYTFSFFHDKITNECLIDLTTQKAKTIFKRNHQNIENISTAKKFGFTEKLLRKTRPTTLLITKAREDNNKYANIIFDFFTHLNIVTCGTPDIRDFSINLLKSTPTMKDKVLQFLRNADFWIRDIKIDEFDTPDEVMKELPFIESFKKNFQKTISITTSHSVRDDKHRIVGATNFSLDGQESAGTRIIFDLAALLILSIEQKSILYIDEFGIHLHPDICLFILHQFASDPGTQLILNTHDSSLMNSLTRESIMLVDKNQAEESFITSLASLSPRADDPFEKHYRKGLYGAKPLVKESA